MARALELAAQADHRTSPNPMVGAVVLDAAGQLAGEGWHERAGTPHAEVHALAAAGARARGGTLYVNLEPCNHHGRTPPCSEACVSAALKRIVIATTDPDPRTAGAGVDRLRASGIDVTVGVLADAAEDLNRFFLHRHRTGRPWVTAKFGASLDGRTATRTGDSKWITGEAARARAHRSRHRHDAILVGINTVESDDPQLTARFPNARQPIPIVLDSALRLRPTANLARPGTIVATTESAPDRPDLAAKGVEILRLPGHRPDLRALLATLAADHSILSVLVEGGATVHGALFDAGLVDGVEAYLAPTIIGGATAQPAVGGLGAATLPEATHLHRVTLDRLGDELVVEALVKRPE